MDCKPRCGIRFFGWLGSGLLDRDLTKQPAYMAYQFASQIIGGAKFFTEISDHHDIKILEFNRGDRQIWLLWSKDGNDHIIQLPKEPLESWDALGNPIAAGTSIVVTPKPLYILWVD